MGTKLRGFVMKGLRAAIGEWGDHVVIHVAAEWHHRGVLSEADLAEIEAAIDAKNGVVAEVIGE